MISLKCFSAHFLYVIELILILIINTSEQNQSKKHHNKNNLVITAEIGQNINISCWVDPNLFVRKEAKIEDDSNSYKFKRSIRNKLKKFNSLNDNNWSNYNEEIAKDESYFNNKYEIDWYFLDKKGRMNIISYGNKTTKLKYKTFFNNGLNGNTRSLNNHLVKNNPKIFTYYLNTIIESEDDEGVYQCINPDWPSFVIRNVTVLIAKNSAVVSTLKNYLLQLLLFEISVIYFFIK